MKTILKIVVTGAVNSGKTEFIKSISEIGVVSTERRTTDETKVIKEHTTVAMDFGRLTIDEDVVLYIFGTPGQERFDFMWDILSEGMMGYILLVDSTQPNTFVSAQQIFTFFQNCGPEVPFVVAANKQDLDGSWAAEDVKFLLGLPDDAPVVPCVAKNVEYVKNALLELLLRITGSIDE